MTDRGERLLKIKADAARAEDQERILTRRYRLFGADKKMNYADWYHEFLTTNELETVEQAVEAAADDLRAEQSE
jgi:hypothetical protein